MPRRLYLIPNVISETDENVEMLRYLLPLTAALRHFFVEEEKTARRLLKKINPALPVAECEFILLNEHSRREDIEKDFKNWADKDIGIISESGCPCVADPGAEVVSLAHREGREVIPLVGPSSTVLALMASGLSGQNFAFNGYLPKERPARIKKIKELELRSQREGQTQIFMEAPYRNQNMLEDILATCSSETMLCVACDLTASTQFIKTLPVGQWKKTSVLIDKRPALFLLQKR